MTKLAPLIALVAMVSLGAGQKHDWGYEASFGRAAPENWSKTYKACSGKRQSPIDVVDSAIKPDPTLKAIRFIGYDEPLVGLTLKNDGHALRVELPSNYDLRIQTASLPASYKLLQFHFHWPSEHTFNGNQFPLELHFVHANTKVATDKLYSDPTGLVVVTVVFDYRQGSYIGNSLKTILSKTASISKENQSVNLTTPLVLEDLLPQDRFSYVRYSGSLTTPTPDCAEVAEFHILTNTVAIGQSHVARFASLRHEYEVSAGKHVEGTIERNNRPIQPLNGRTLRLHGDMGDLPNDL